MNIVDMTGSDTSACTIFDKEKDRNVLQMKPFYFNPTSLFMNGENEFLYDVSMSYMYTDAAGTDRVDAVNDYVGKIVDKSGNGSDATQTTSTARPVVVSRNSKLCIESDHFDDYMTATLAAPVTGEVFINTPYGYQHNTNREFTGTNRIPLCWTRQVIAHEGMTAEQRARVVSYFGTDQKFMIGTVKKNTFDNLRIYGTGMSAAARTVRFIDANGTVLDYTHAGTNTPVSVTLNATLDTSKPVIVLFPIELASSVLLGMYMHTNQLTGSIPDLSANTALCYFFCNTNQLTGSIPDLSANTALAHFYCNTNQLTGSIPDLSANTYLTQFYCHTNQLTGSIPDLSANTYLLKDQE